MPEKVGKSRNTVFFQWFVAPEGGKVGSLKRRVRSQLARWEMKNCTLLWREAHFEVKMCKPPQRRTTFGSWDVEKVHAVVARSTFRSQNVQSTSASDHFWKLRCRKSARRCGAKHISKSKCTKHLSVGPLLEVEMSKKCTQLWREAHFQVKVRKTHHSRTTFGSWDVEKCTPLGREAHFEVKMLKTPGVRTTFGGSDVEKVHAVVARSTFRSQNVKKKQGFGSLLEVQMSLRVAGARDCAPCQKWAKREGLVTFSTTTATTPHYTTLCSNTLHYTTTTTTPSLHSTTLHSTTLHCTQVHSITLHYITLHYITLRYTTLHYTTFHYNSLHYTTLRSTTLQLQLRNYTPLH